MKNVIKDTAILFVITILVGLILSVVYEVTKEPIARQEEAARQEAFKAVFKQAQSFENVELDALKVEALLVEKEHTGVTLEEAVAAKDASGTTLGYCITVTTHEGYNGDIKLTIGITMDGTINGISILEIAETPGLGLEAENMLIPQFAGKNAEVFEYTKTGALADNQVDALSSATITTKAVTKAVNAGLEVFRSMLGGGQNE